MGAQHAFYEFAEMTLIVGIVVFCFVVKIFSKIVFILMRK